MRIVSSDGCLDIPYERVNLFVGNDNRLLTAFDDSENVHTMGKYDSHERVLDVMEYVRYAYIMGRKVYTMPEK